MVLLYNDNGSSVLIFFLDGGPEEASIYIGVTTEQ